MSNLTRLSMLIILSTEMFHPILTMSNCWKFHIKEHDNDGTIPRAMHLLDVTMANNGDVFEICYGMRHFGGSVGLQGYINFHFEKNKFMVMQLLPDFWVSDMNYFDDTDDFVDFLCQNSFLVKMG